jgi:CRISPR-associated protein (Cas_Csd1)
MARPLAADRRSRGRKQEKDAATDAGACVFQETGHNAALLFSLGHTAYALGVSADEKKAGHERLEAFRQLHQRELAGTVDPRLRALLRFIESWPPVEFARLGWSEEMKDQIIVFALESERLRNIASTTDLRRGRCGRGFAVRVIRNRRAASSSEKGVRSRGCMRPSRASEAQAAGRMPIA